MSRLKTKRPDELLVEYFYELKGWDYEDKEFLKENKIVFGRHLNPAKNLLILCDNNFDKAKELLNKTREWAESFGGEDWLIETAIKKFLEFSNSNSLQLSKITGR